MMANLLEILTKVDAQFQLKEAAENEKNFLGKLKYTFVVGDKKNKNDRTYPSSILEREIDEFNLRLGSQNIAGQLQHPTASLHAELDKISHLITSVAYDKNSKRGVAESSILKTTRGKDLLVLLKASVPVGASIRGKGQVDQQGVVMNDYKLESIDLVSAPSFGADTAVTANNLIESANTFFLRSELSEEELNLERFKMAEMSGYKGTFKQFVESRKSAPVQPGTLTEDQKTIIKYERAIEAGFRGSLEQYEKGSMKG